MRKRIFYTACFAFFVVVIYSSGYYASDGGIRCMCTTEDCRTNGIRTCTTSYACFIQYTLNHVTERESLQAPSGESNGSHLIRLDSTDGAIRGCLDNNNIMLCPGSSAGALRNDPQKVLCCKQDLCNIKFVQSLAETISSERFSAGLHEYYRDYYEDDDDDDYGNPRHGLSLSLDSELTDKSQLGPDERFSNDRLISVIGNHTMLADPAFSLPALLMFTAVIVSLCLTTLLFAVVILALARRWQRNSEALDYENLNPDTDKVCDSYLEEIFDTNVLIAATRKEWSDGVMNKADPIDDSRSEVTSSSRLSLGPSDTTPLMSSYHSPVLFTPTPPHGHNLTSYYSSDDEAELFRDDSIEMENISPARDCKTEIRAPLILKTATV